jgi:hypothetical protein
MRVGMIMKKVIIGCLLDFLRVSLFLGYHCRHYSPVQVPWHSSKNLRRLQMTLYPDLCSSPAKVRRVQGV